MEGEGQNIFLSYSRDDQDFALKLAGDLRSAGANIWIDQLDIETGERWDDAIEEALATAESVLVILSPTAVDSKNVKDEVADALRKKKQVLPVLYLDCKIPFRLARLQYSDFTTDYEKGLTQLLGALDVEQRASADYLDFEMQLSAGSEGAYRVEVLRSPAGTINETIQLPFDEAELASRLQAVEKARGAGEHTRKAGEARRDRMAPPPADREAVGKVEDFGRELFEALMASEVRAYYRTSLNEARKQKKGLRLRLRIEAPELAALPWEYLYDEAEGDYVCLSTETPLIRYLELGRPQEPLIIEPPLRILGMVASPHDFPELDVAGEKQLMTEAIEQLVVAGIVEITWLKGQTSDALQDAMLEGRPERQATRVGPARPDLGSRSG